LLGFVTGLSDNVFLAGIIAIIAIVGGFMAGRWVWVVSDPWRGYRQYEWWEETDLERELRERSSDPSDDTRP
jgi:hypothetical protein